ncbi:MAG: peptide-methionine (R)-S-oxide reductase MsrB [Gammaproteobacteria bacterium]|nr:peptide-methionine (R)-S-oxide reductase MsrB [Gammaproteobacteria bacterium]
MSNKIRKSDDEWRERLTPDQYAITRQAATEPPFSGKYCDTKEQGIYNCVCCGAQLFDASSKYDSGSGWPSFWEPAEQSNIEEREDLSHGMRRVEIVCARCDAHLGHVFPDGPEPTGLRYCVNSGALDLDKDV